LPSFEEDMKSIDNSVEKWKDKEIDIKPLFLERMEKNQLKKAKNNILKVKPCLKEVENIFFNNTKRKSG
jgi:hypothetical protein